jgi:hypothetical protein
MGLAMIVPVEESKSRGMVEAGFVQLGVSTLKISPNGKV